MKVCAIILAAGSGSRMRSKTKKQFMEIKGKPIIWFALNAFQESNVDEIVLVTSGEDIEFCKRIVERYGISKVTKIVEGGKERYNSVYNGLRQVKCDYVLIHDGARPLVSRKIIEDCIEGVKEYKACVAGVPVKDTIKIADENGVVVSTPPRDKMWITQTPQAFEYNLLKKTYDNIEENGNNNITDDAMVVEKYSNAKVKFIESSYKNIKVTTPEDIGICEMFLNET